MAYGFQGLKSLGLEGEQTQEAPMSLPVKQPEYDPSGYASFAKPSVSDTKGEIKQSPRDIVTAKYGYTPGQMPGINKDVAGVQGTAFNNWDDTTKQSIRKSIAETPVVKKPSVKEAVRKAGYNPDQSLADLSATLIANGGDITPEDLQMKFPEFAGKEQAVSDFIATMAATPNITPEEVKMKFPEFYDQQAIGMDGGLRATAARGNEERSIYSKIGDALNPAGLLTEFIDNVAQKIPVFDPEAYVDRKTGERVGELTPEKVAEYYKKYESSPNAKKLFGSFDEYIKAKHMTLLEGLIDSPTITMYANMPGSFAKNYSGIARGIENPVDTAIGLYKLAATPEGHAMLMQRYGTQKGREDAIKYDPVGVASDLLTIVEGGANLTRLSAKGTSLVAKAAGAEKLAANATKVATQAGEVAITAGGASNLGADIAINKGFNVLGSMAEGNKIAEKTIKIIKFAQAPVSETFKAAKKGKVGEFVTRTLPVSRIEKTLGLTPTERGNVESTGVSAGEYMLQKNLGGLEKEEQISRLANIADESYNGVTKELKKIPLNVRTASEPAKKMLQVMVDEMESSKIVADAYPDYISKLKEMIAQKDYHPEELNAIKRDFDKIVGSKMYNSKGRVTNFEDGIIDGYRKELYSQLETVANEHGLDIRGMNTDMRNAMTIRNGLIRRASQVNKNNTFGLQDIGIGAILAAGDPVTATAVVLAKKGIEQAVPGISQKLYNLNPKKTGSNPNLKRGVPVSPRDKSNGMSITNTAADRRILAGKIEADYKTKNPALPEKSQGYNLGTKKNPIVAKAPKGYVAKPMKDLSNMEKIAATPQDAPKKGYETKIGKVTDITNNGGAYPTYRVKVEGSDKRHNIDEIGGVYKPKSEVKMPRQEKTAPVKQEPKGLEVAPGGRKAYYLRLIKEEYGLDINKMETEDMLKVKDAINSRTPEKTIKILEELQKKYARSEKGLPQKSIAKVAKKEKASTLEVVTPKKKEMAKTDTLYHGTAKGNNFEKYDRSKAGMGVGSNAIDQGNQIYLTESEYAAGYFGKLANDRKQMLIDKKMPDGAGGDVLKFKLSSDAKVLDVEDMPRGAKAAQAVIDKANNEGYDAIRFTDKGFDTIEGQSKEFYDKIYKDGKAPKTTIVINESKLEKVAEKKAPVVDAPKLDMQAKIKKLQDTKMSSVDSMALDDAISLVENGKNRVDAIYTTYFPKGDSVSNPIDMGYGKETPTKSLEAEARKYKSADEFVKSNGDPLYHGTTSKFDEFDKEYMGKATDPGVIGEGFYFTNNKKFADGYAKGDKANVINAYINTKKLFDIGELKNAGQAAKQLGMKPEDFYWTQDGKIVPKNFKVASKFGKKLQELGYDGATFERYPGSIETVVFDPKNIKTETQLRKIREEANNKGLKPKK